MGQSLQNRFCHTLYILSGINSVIKGPPWYDPKMLNPARWAQLEDWGFNAVRQGTVFLRKKVNRLQVRYLLQCLLLRKCTRHCARASSAAQSA
jgi:hypothetical protein